ncbi:hypothetical protein PoB_001094200 [Plakobranchus ocellatus]|uniref:Uncharacterized protein n=1 Tax=Plakobranchus ocellatus TaxID=259542 RepID=A0AAV3YNC3_9GAST|nr:hypothetical protein PoB_001094200 [Plakobranchus ocellatus]
MVYNDGHWAIKGARYDRSSHPPGIIKTRCFLDAVWCGHLPLPRASVATGDHREVKYNININNSSSSSSSSNTNICHPTGTQGLRINDQSPCSLIMEVEM